MKRKITSFITALLTVINLLPATRIYAAEPYIYYSGDTYASAYTEREFSLSASFDGDETDITSLDISVSYGSFELIDGSSTVGGAELGASYYYTFVAPKSMATGKYYITFQLAYTYTYEKGTNPDTDPDVTKSGVKTATVTIDVTNDTGGVSTTEPSITNSGSSSVIANPDENFRVTVNISSSSTLDSLSISINPGDLTLISGITSITGASLGKTYEYTLLAPKGTTGKHYIQFSVGYTYAGGEKNGTKVFTVVVDIGGSTGTTGGVILENVKYPKEIGAGINFPVTADIFNDTGVNLTDAAFTVSDSDGNELAKKYIGAVAVSEAATPAEVEVPGFNKPGRYTLNIKLAYKKSGIAGNVTKAITVNVSSSTLTVENITYPDKISLNQSFDLGFSVINNGEEDVKSCQVELYRDSALLKSLYIGVVPHQSKADNTISLTLKDNKNLNFKFVVTYKTASGVSEKTERSFKLTIADGIGELKLQNIEPSLKAEINTYAELKFTLSNPSENPVKGAEVFLYDESNIQLASAYIAEVEPNSSKTETLNFPVKGRLGNRSYKVSVVYTNNKNVQETISRTFTVNAVTAEEAAKDEDGKPSNIKIQKIDNPAMLYSGARVKIPITLVNGGKGTAYNVELYIIDNSDGKEVAREYVGSLAPSESRACETSLKFDLIGTKELTLHVYYENSDNSTNTVSRDFEQKVINYRVSLADITGYEWITQNMPVTIEFAVINNGNESMLNTNVRLIDASGRLYGEVYIGNIAAGEKKERQRIRDVIFSEAGPLELTLELTYENADMEEFPILTPLAANVTEDPSGGDWGKGGEMFIDENMGMIDPGMEELPKGGMASWLIILICAGGGLVLIAGIIIVIIVVKKKKASKNEDDDLDYFLSQLKKGKEPASGPNPTLPEANSEQQQYEEINK